jgi:hypothetical protein
MRNYKQLKGLQLIIETAEQVWEMGGYPMSKRMTAHNQELLILNIVKIWSTYRNQLKKGDISLKRENIGARSSNVLLSF